MGAMEILILAARVAQFVFAIIVLGCTAWGATWWSNNVGNGAPGFLPNTVAQINFNIFVAVWSVLIVGYQIAVPRFSETLGHKFIVFGLDALTALFWFAAFIALAVWNSNEYNYISYVLNYDGYAIPDSYTNFYHVEQAGAAFGAFSWFAFMITTVLSGINIFRGNTGSAKHHGGIGNSVA